MMASQWGGKVTSEPRSFSEAELIRDVIGKLNLALEICYKRLGEIDDRSGAKASASVSPRVR